MWLWQTQMWSKHYTKLEADLSGGSGQIENMSMAPFVVFSVNLFLIPQTLVFPLIFEIIYSYLFLYYYFIEQIFIDRKWRKSRLENKIHIREAPRPPTYCHRVNVDDSFTQDLIACCFDVVIRNDWGLMMESGSFP